MYYAVFQKQPALSAILSQIMKSVSLDLYASGSLQSLGILLYKRATSTQSLNNDPMILAAFSMALR